jgi:NitT/TauT family transport system permease protein
VNLFGFRLPLFSSLVLWALLWELVGHTEAKLILPPLSAISLRIIEIIPTESFLKALMITGKAFFIGSGIAMLVGIPLGVMMGRSKVFDDLLLPWVNVMLSAPLSALVPVIMVVAGIGRPP